MGSPWTLPQETSNGAPYLVPVSGYKGQRMEIGGGEYPVVPLYNNHHHHHHLQNNNNHNHPDHNVFLHNDHNHNTVSSNINNNRGVDRKRQFYRLGILTEDTAKRRQGDNRPYVVSLREIPSWDIYFNDQRHRLVAFADISNPTRPDLNLNKCVSLCFDEICITKLAVDAIVTSTTQNYAGASGVDKKIHDAAGRGLREACKNLPPCDVGNAEITHGFDLPAKYVIHTNGPNGLFGSENSENLKNCYENSLKLLLQYNLRTIAFPCISTGSKGMIHKAAAVTALATVRKFLEQNPNKVDRVIFCLHNPKDITIYRRFMQVYFPVAD